VKNWQRVVSRATIPYVYDKENAFGEVKLLEMRF
jgi:hypothetical protein